MNAPCPIPQPDPATILSALAALFQPDDVVELRSFAKGGRKRTDAGYFDGGNRQALAEHAVRLNKTGGAVYVTLNPIDPQLLSRYANRIEHGAQATTTDAQVTRRRWLLLDFDPARPTDTSATDAQLEHAKAAARVCWQALRAEGWPDPLVAESGNGTHLLYALDLPNDTESRDLVKGALAGLAARFDTDQVKLDQSVFNAGRIIKLYGTVATKGDHTPLAPWRLSQLVATPERSAVVTADQLRAWIPAKTATPLAQSASHQPGNGQLGAFDLDNFLVRLGIAAEQDIHEGSDRFKLAHCPFNPEHGKGEAAIFRKTSGALGFKCQHNSCSGKRWEDVRALVDGAREQRQEPAVDFSGLLNQGQGATPESALSGDGRKLRGALAAIPKDAKSGKHSASNLIGMALRHSLSGIDEGEGAALCSEWDRMTGGASLAVFQKSNPDYCATQPVTTASVFALAKAHGWAGEPEPEPWGEPLPIPSALLPVEPFDVALLPEALAPWVADIAERMQCPIDFPAVGAMVALSSVVGRKACIRPKRHDDWQVTPNLWGVIVGRPGVMKSPALAEVLRPLDRLAAIAGEAHKAALRDHEIKAKLEGMAGKAAETKAQKLVAAGKIGEAEQLLAGAADAEEAGKPALRRYKVTDATMEALSEILIDNPWGTLAYRDELNGLLRSLDKEGQEGARAFYLQGYDGNQGYTSDRILRGRNLHIDAVCIAMLGGIQPGKLQAYIRDAVSGGAGDDGLLQRFGLLVWPDVTGEWRNVDRWPDTDAKRVAFETFQRLDALAPGVDPDDGKEVPAVYRFSDPAQALFDDWRKSFETALRSDEHHPAMESHLAKYRKLVPAIALVCALADGKGEVDGKDLLRALAWSEYLQTHAARAYAAGTRPETDGATALLAKIKAGAVVDDFKPADVYLKGWSYLGSPEVVKSAAQMLCDLGHLRRVVTRQQQGAGRPAISYHINPATRARG
ncbi:MAG: YfjI family protein [Accumulibacter sp.]|jgi:hypothetical protein|uniref:YfjI family protein n=1 Tax=Accumulibacter sp. TaxID=2053492 RepID=UPI002FC2BB6C